MLPPVPILRSYREEEARDFYLRFLGFEIGFEHRFGPDLPLYMEVRRGAAVLHLSEHHGDASPGAAVRIETDGLADYHREITARGHRGARPGIVEQSWGFREMALTDPAGNRLIFCERLPET
ncbi:glyoxalase superfamily protein [Litorisediminicola beolgyonensis]|uniref:Bleomycin resistance protein n=1 Tax=Litorisediminicola beolgyonensis TaxID=1173614 RepID=A0ABW3ZNH1_9RHOB